GDPPDPSNLPAGCTFAPRCPLAIDACRQAEPPLTAAGEGRLAACIRMDAVDGAVTAAQEVS
ncbi:MAG: ABC transporter ATP-binding protein, partial [Catenulispora sp.]|nr:ABC transporter ATP-binding protein [Catenulispora sp.]